MKPLPGWTLLVLAGLCFALAFSDKGCTVTSPLNPAPISDPGFRALLTYSEAGRSTLPPGQKQIYDSTAIPAYLDAHCVKDKTNVPEWRLWPDTEVVKDDQPVLQKALALVKGKGQMVVVSDGKVGTVQPWPADEAAMLTLLKKYGGP